MSDVRTVYIVSDLHLGGDPEFRMMTEPERLAAFISAIAAHDASTDKQELVINGDFVDFLSEAHGEDERGNPHWEPFLADPEQAVACFRKIAGGMDAPVFDALAELLEAGHRLTVLPGNHDVELCLPAVRRALLERLRARPGYDLYVQHDGEGYAIGDAIVEHGNRYDASNFVDHERLHNLRVKQSLRRDEPAELPFAAPLGSYFVARVMNEIKRGHPFVDLLKPEGPALVALLLAIDPGLRETVKGLAKLALEHRREHADATKAWEEETTFRGGVRGTVEPEGPRARRVAEPEGPRARRIAEPDGDEALAMLLEETLGEGVLAEPQEPGAAAFEPEREPARGQPREAIRGPVGDAWKTLHTGGWEVVRLLVSGGRFKEVKRLELLRQAVRKMGASPEFDRGKEDERSPYLAAARKLARSATHKGGFRFVIFGHTHHAKDIALDGLDARYLNSGTWANLMSFPAELFDQGTDEQQGERVLREFVEDLRAGRLASRVRFEPTYVRLSLGADGNVREAAVEVFAPAAP